MAVDVLLGLQWGDEGKGKIVDYLAPQYDIIARFQGGPNAGHSLHFEGNKFVLHTIPSGIFREGIINIIGNGVVVDPITLHKEIADVSEFGIEIQERLLVSHKAQLILPTHRLLDKASEAAKGKDKIGSTLKGIGPTYMDKTGRNGLRFGDIFSAGFQTKYEALKQKHLQLSQIYPEVDFNIAEEEERWFRSIEELKTLKVINGEYYFASAINQGKRILAEGAQGSMLDIDYGTYPFVTSSNTLSSGVCAGLGVSPRMIGKVIGITKSYCTRVGSGPFPTELNDDVGEKLQRLGHEFGATTGRRRRCGWVDLVQLQYVIMLNGVDELVLTKLDVLSGFEEIKYANSYTDLTSSRLVDEFPFDLCDRDLRPNYQSTKGWLTDISSARRYHDLPEEAKTYVGILEEALNIRCKYISVGPDRDELIVQ